MCKEAFVIDGDDEINCETVEALQAALGVGITDRDQQPMVADDACLCHVDFEKVARDAGRGVRYSGMDAADDRFPVGSAIFERA